jgi:hypothetical protein
VEQVAAVAPENPAAQPTSAELQQGVVAAPVDGAGVPNVQQPTEGEGEGQQPDASDRPETPEHRRLNKRFSDYAQRTREAEIRAARAEAEVEAYRRMGVRPQPETQQPVAQPTLDNAEPDPNAYPGGEWDPQYVKDSARFEARQEFAEQAQRQRDLAEFEAGRQRYQQTLAQADELAGQSEDFANAPRYLELIGRHDRETSDMVLGAENPVHVAEWIGRNPDLARKLASMHPFHRAAQIGRIDATISANIAAASRRPAPAPEPGPAAQAPTLAPQPAPGPSPTLTGRGAAPGFNPYDPNVTQEQYNAWRASGGG